MKILVVEDFAIDREELLEMLASFQDLPIEEVKACENGRLALAAADSFLPDVVLCDVEMPYMDGFDLLRAMREKHPDVKFVFCSLYNRL